LRAGLSIQIDEPVDEQTFEDGLVERLRTANANDVAIEWAWECCVTDEDGWEVEIVPLSSERPD